MNTRCAMLVLFAGSAWLGSAQGLPITIQVDYAAPGLPTIDCSLWASSCPTPEDFGASPGSSLTFVIEDFDRAVDGAYDVSASLAGPLADSFADFSADLVAAGVVPSSSLTASATTSDGLVLDLLLNFTLQAIVESVSNTQLDYHFTTAGGSYVSSTTTAVPIFGAYSVTYTGGYTITQPPADREPEPDPVSVPEPGTWLLLVSGLLYLLGSGPSRRVLRNGVFGG